MSDCNLFISGIVLVTLLHASVLSKPIQELEGADFGTYGMTYLGSADGKSFFYETYPQRTWSDAKNACNESNMRLATITSESQAKFLNEITNMAYYTNYGFWTAGRDSQTISQFAWDESNETASNHGFNIHINTLFLTCLLFAPRLTSTGDYLLYSCTQPWGTLCETYNTE